MGDKGRLRVVHVITRLILGGAQENTVLTCEGLQARGWDVTLVTGPPLGPEGDLLERARSGGYGVIVLDALRREIHPWRDWRAYRQLRQLFRSDRPDIVHTHSSKAGILGRWAAWKERVPGIVHTIHGLPFHEYQPRFLHYFYRACERAAALRCHRILCVGEVMREKAVAAGLASMEKFGIVYSGIEVDRFRDVQDACAVRSQLGIPGDARVVGVVSRLAALKGHEYVIDAAEMLRSGHESEGRLHLLFVGDGLRREVLERRAKERGVPVTLAGMVPPERIPAFLSAMDILVHPSFREGLPRAVVQALLAGVPVVAFDCDGAREVVQDGVTGYLVAPGDLAGLCVAMRRAFHEGRAPAEEGRRRTADRFRWERMVETLEETYREVLERHADEGAI